MRKVEIIFQKKDAKKAEIQKRDAKKHGECKRFFKKSCKYQPPQNDTAHA